MSHHISTKPPAPEEDKHEKLKRKYTTLVDTHRKLLDDYDLAL